MDPSEKSVYLTFDDGPIPEATPWIIETLERYGVKATFFMVGDNVRKHPKEFELVKSHGHRIGNHTYNHIGGVFLLAVNYLKNVDKANKVLKTDLQPNMLTRKLNVSRGKLSDQYHVQYDARRNKNGSFITLTLTT